MSRRTIEVVTCPTCADRYATIHMEVTPTEDGRSCHHEYSWRDEA